MPRKVSAYRPIRCKINLGMDRSKSEHFCSCHFIRYCCPSTSLCQKLCNQIRARDAHSVWDTLYIHISVHVYPRSRALASKYAEDSGSLSKHAIILASGVFRTSDHRVSFGARSRRIDSNIGRFEDCRFQVDPVLQVFCEFEVDELSPDGETE
jgi:hypothetical protein